MIEFQALEILLNDLILSEQRFVRTSIPIISNQIEQTLNKNTMRAVSDFDFEAVLSNLKILDNERNLILKTVHKLEIILEHFEDILQDEDLLNDLIISKQLLEKKQVDGEIEYWLSETQENKIIKTDIVQEMEEMIENCCLKLSAIRNECRQLIGKIEVCKQNVQLRQDIIRNQVMMKNLNLNQLHVSIMLCALPMAALGMNLDSGFLPEKYASVVPFYSVCLLCTLVGIPFTHRIILNSKLSLPKRLKHSWR